MTELGQLCDVHISWRQWWRHQVKSGSNVGIAMTWQAFIVQCGSTRHTLNWRDPFLTHWVSVQFRFERSLEVEYWCRFLCYVHDSFNLISDVVAKWQVMWNKIEILWPRWWHQWRYSATLSTPLFIYVWDRVEPRASSKTEISGIKSKYCNLI